MAEEEGEIFRKGIVLLGPAEMEGDYAGEELRREVRAIKIVILCLNNSHFFQLLEAMVERPPPRPLTDDFGLLEDIPDEDHSPNRSPNIPAAKSRVVESSKPPPKPYVSRSRSSSNSILNLISPSSSTPGDSPTAAP